MHSEVDEVRDAGDGSYQLNVDNEFRDAAEVQRADESAAPSRKCDLASKPTAAAAAPLSSRASAFSIASLMMKDRDSDSGDETVAASTQQHSSPVGALYAVAATDQWPQYDREYSDSGDVAKTKTPSADYWLTFSNTSQRRTYIQPTLCYIGPKDINTRTKYALLYTDSYSIICRVFLHKLNDYFAYAASQIILLK